MTMRQRLAHIALGGVLVLSGVIASSFLQTSDAQQPASNIVKAREFHLVNALGSTTAIIASHPNGKGLEIKNTLGRPGMSVTIDSDGGFLSIRNSRGEVAAAIFATSDGGKVGVRGANGSATISIDEHGGEVHIFGKGSKTSRAAMSINEYGNGAVSTWDKNGYRIGDLR